MSATGTKENRMPEAVSNSVNQSVPYIFKTIIGSEPDFIGVDENKTIGEGVVGIISFVGDVTWLLMLALPRQSATNMASKFCGFEVDYDSPDMGDVVGELANVLAGDIVARLANEGVKVAMSLPTIMRGHDVEPLLPRGAPSEKMYYSFPDGELLIKIASSNKGDTICRTPGA